MILSRLLGTAVVAFGLLGAQQPLEDPVMKARALRAQTGGDQDLPPVPRTVLEPPPLPPPELHVKDTRGYRASKSRRGKKVKSSATKKAPAKGTKVRTTKKSPAVKK